jgi:hypothetical protein
MHPSSGGSKDATVRCCLPAERIHAGRKSASSFAGYTVEGEIDGIGEVTCAGVPRFCGPSATPASLRSSQQTGEGPTRKPFGIERDLSFWTLICFRNSARNGLSFGQLRLGRTTLGIQADRSLRADRIDVYGPRFVCFSWKTNRSSNRCRSIAATLVSALETLPMDAIQKELG